MIHSSVLTHLSIRMIELSTLPNQELPLIPLNSHSCAKSRSKSPRITSLRENTPGGGFIPILEPSTCEPSNLKTSASSPPQVSWNLHLQMCMKTNNFKPSRIRTYANSGGVGRAAHPARRDGIEVSR